MIRKRHLTSLSFPIRHRRIADQNDIILDLFFGEEIAPIIEACDYVRGEKDCPVCKGLLKWSWSKEKGFLVYECTENDCLPWPTGGAMQKRTNNQSEIIPTRYTK